MLSVLFRLNNDYRIRLKLTISIVFFILISCSRNEEPDNIVDPIRLSSDFVSFLPGEECIIDVFSKMEDLALLEENPNIASGWWTNQGQSILIRGESVGETFITIRDRKNPNISAEIRVVANYFSGDFEEQGDKSSIIVQACDNSIVDIINDELKIMAEKRSGIIYSFNKDNKTVDIDYSNSGYKKKKHIYDYDWGKDYLYISIEGNVDKYGFGSFDSSKYVMLEIDLLEVYKIKFPDANVSIAKLKLFLSRRY